MSVEYAPRGLIGILTPQANTTVEPELTILLPPGVAFINGRLCSSKPTIEARLIDYFEQFDDAVGQFANAPIDAVAIACTGSSYLAGIAREDAVLQRLKDATSVPIMTAASAVVDALRAIEARRIGLVSPYPPGLTHSSIVYWQARGFTVAAVASAEGDSKSFHPVYALSSDGTSQALDKIADADLDAVVMLGTGMPSLRPIRERPRLGRAPVMSCMLCLAWRAAVAVEHTPLTAGSVLAWIDEPEWYRRLAERLP